MNEAYYAKAREAATKRYICTQETATEDTIEKSSRACRKAADFSVDLGTKALGMMNGQAKCWLGRGVAHCVNTLLCQSRATSKHTKHFLDFRAALQKKWNGGRNKGWGGGTGDEAGGVGTWEEEIDRKS